MPEEKVSKPFGETVADIRNSYVQTAADAGPRQSQAEKELSNSIRRAGEAFNWDLNAFFTHVKAERAKLATAPPKSCHNCGKPMADTQVRCLFCDAYEPATPPVPQEAAPTWRQTDAQGNADPNGAYVTATAPDSAMRVAEQICRDCFRAGDTSQANHIAALIREAGSERERELEGKLRRSYELANIFAKKIAMLTLSEKSYDEYSSALKELAEASRLLGGESNG